MGLLQDKALTALRRGLARAAPGAASWDPLSLAICSADAGPYVVRPAAVAEPADAAGVARVVRLAAAARVGVSARGGGTGLVGGALGPGIALSTRRLGRIRVGGGCLEAGAGASKGAADAALRRRGLFLGPNPSVGPYCTVGGMVATNAAGSRSLRYGAAVDCLLGAEFVDGTGRVRRLPGDDGLAAEVAGICAEARAGDFPRTSKNSCGYRLDAVRSPRDAHRVLAGSEGTLGILVSARMRAFPAPARRDLHVLWYPSEAAAAAECADLLRAGPSALEMVGEALAAGMGPPVPAGGCLLLAEFEGGAAPPAGLRGRAVEVAGTEAAAARWWRARDTALARSLGGRPAHHLIEDAAVPAGRLPDLVEAIGRAGRAAGARPAVYGHAGDGNLHVRLAAPVGPEVARAYFRSVVGMGGTISGEHGDGIARAGYLGMQYGPGARALFGRLKALLDPLGVLNPGKIASPGGAAGPAAGPARR